MRTEARDASPRVFRIAIYVGTDLGYTRRIIQGVAAACIERGLLSRLIDPRYMPLPDPRQWGADGVISTIYDEESTRAALSWGIPVINVSSRLRESTFPSVWPDNRRIGEIAARHFLYQKARTFVCKVLGAARFVDERLEGFQKAIQGSGHRVEVLPDKPLSDPQVIAFLKHARKPVGFFALADSQAYSLLEALAESGLAVPGDVQVIGVDNDELLCLMTNPRLSSVDCNFETIGGTAVKLLHEWLLTGQRPPEETRIPPAGLVLRQSSNLISTNDGLVNEALQLIRAGSPSRPTVKQLINRLATSRRRLELRFHEELGSTPAKEILRVQIESACQLLIDTELPLLRVAESSGLGSERQMRKVFRRTLGITPSEYREQFRQRLGRKHV